MQRFLPLFVFLSVLLQPGYAQYFDTLHLRYAIGMSEPDVQAQQQLDSLVQRIDGRKLLIYSYADYLGSEQSNQHLSDRRALHIKTYLLGKGISEMQILECTGLGRIPGAGSAAGNPDHRRSDIFIRRREPVPLTKVTTPPAGPLAAAQPKTQGVLIQTEEENKPKFSPIDLSTAKVNDVIRLKHIGFYPGRADVVPSSYGEVENLYQVLSANPRLKIRLEGHVCCCIYPDGFFKDTPTWQLSVDRAHAIYKHLADRGIDTARLSYQGFGRTRPIVDLERTSAEGQVNRRVEVRIMEK